MYSIEFPVPTSPLSFVFPSGLRAFAKIFPDLVSNIPLSDKVSFLSPKFILSSLFSLSSVYISNVPPVSFIFPPIPLILVFILPDPVISISLFILLLFNSPIPTTEPFPVRRILKSENFPLNSPSNFSLSLPNAKVDFLLASLFANTLFTLDVPYTSFAKVEPFKKVTVEFPVTFAVPPFSASPPAYIFPPISPPDIVIFVSPFTFAVAELPSAYPPP